MISSERAGSVVAGRTSVAPIRVSVVIEPSPAIVWNGMTNSQVSSGPVRRPQLQAGAVEIR
jgi:hypothetical protein